MDESSPLPEDLSALERRLSAWQPSFENLTPDRMLFAAGRASAPSRRTPVVWPAATACLALLAAALGVWLASERSERLVLARQLRERREIPDSPPSVRVQGPSPTPDTLPPDSYLRFRRALERDAEARPAPVSLDPGPAPGPLPTAGPILQVRQRGRAPDL